MRATLFFVSLGAGPDPRFSLFNNPKYFQCIFFFLLCKLTSAADQYLLGECNKDKSSVLHVWRDEKQMYQF